MQQLFHGVLEGTQGDKARSPGSLFKTVRLIDMTLDTQDWKRGHWVWLTNSPDPTTCTGGVHSPSPTRGLTVKNLGNHAEKMRDKKTQAQNFSKG